MKTIFEKVENNINNLVANYVIWSQCSSDEEMQNAKNGIINLHLTQTKELPANWFPNSWRGEKVLCLAGVGGRKLFYYHWLCGRTKG